MSYTDALIASMAVLGALIVVTMLELWEVVAFILVVAAVVLGLAGVIYAVAQVVT